MRIGLIVPGFSASEDDWCIPALLDLVRVLSNDHEVVVFALRYPHHRGRYRVYGSVVQAFGGGETARSGRLLLLMRALRAILREHDARPFDLIHGFWSDEPGFLAVTVARLKRIPSVVSLMGGELASIPDIGYGGRLNRLNWWLTRLAMRNASAVTVGSVGLHQLAQAYVAGERLFDAPLGIDQRLFNRGNAGCPGEINLGGSPALLSVGAMVPVKDHIMLLEVLVATIKSFPETHLHIVGDGPSKSKIQEVARGADTLGHITFHGEIAHDLMPAYYRSAAILLVTSRHESQSMVALEAAACGCAVLGTAVGILPQISAPSRSLSPGDDRAFANALLKLIEDPQSLALLQQEGCERVARSYTLERAVPRLINVYRVVTEPSQLTT